jgi:hypothetical protein
MGLCLDADRSREIRSAAHARPPVALRPGRARGRHCDRLRLVLGFGEDRDVRRHARGDDRRHDARRTAQLTLPKGIEWKGGDTTSCDAETLKRGLDACPPAAVIGSGEAIGLTDRAKTVGVINAVNGGKDDVYLSTVVSHPAYVKTIVPGKISKTDDGLKLDFTFPPDLQTIAGVPIGLQQLKLTIKRGPWLVVPKCPDDGWDYDARVGFDDGTQVEHAGKASCSS